MEYQNRYHAVIEAVLFAHGDPVQEKRLAQAAGLSLPALREQIKQMIAHYQGDSHGLMLIHLEGAYQLCTKKEYQQQIQQVLESRKNMPLSQAALEVLAVIAYNQSVTKSFVEQVRGVDSAHIVGSLVQKGLVEESGRLDVPGRPITYQTTKSFLRCFGLSSLSDLPPLPEQQITIAELVEEES